MTALIALGATLLRVLASTPVTASFLTPHVSSVLSTIAALFERGEAAVPELQALSEHVQQMVATGTDPTEEDWAKLKSMSDAAHAAIQAPAGGSST